MTWDEKAARERLATNPHAPHMYPQTTANCVDCQLAGAIAALDTERAARESAEARVGELEAALAWAVVYIQSRHPPKRGRSTRLLC